MISSKTIGKVRRDLVKANKVVMRFSLRVASRDVGMVQCAMRVFHSWWYSPVTVDGSGSQHVKLPSRYSVRSARSVLHRTTPYRTAQLSRRTQR